MAEPAEAPRRFQLSRARGSRKPKEAITVSRPSKWGNPWKAEVVDGVVDNIRLDALVETDDKADGEDAGAEVGDYPVYLTFCGPARR